RFFWIIAEIFQGLRSFLMTRCAIFLGLELVGFGESEKKRQSSVTKELDRLEIFWRGPVTRVQKNEGSLDVGVSAQIGPNQSCPTGLLCLFGTRVTVARQVSHDSPGLLPKIKMNGSCLSGRRARLSKPRSQKNVDQGALTDVGTSDDD